MKNTNKYFEEMEDFMVNVSYPLIYQIEISEKCNLQCPACLNPLMKNKQHMDIELINMIVEKDYLKNTPYVELQMSGEPTLHPNLNEIIDKIKSTGTMVGMSSNIAKLDEDVIKAFNKLDSLTISFDVFDELLYEKSRYPNKWMDFIYNFKEVLNNVSEDVLIYVQLLKTDWTEAKFDESVEKLQDYVKDYPNVVVRYVEDCFEYTRDYKTECKIENKEMCLNPFLTVSIKADGKVVPCCFDFFGEIPYGNLNDDTLEDIWNSGDVEQFRTRHKTQTNLPEKCKRCMYRSPIKLNSSFVSDVLKYKNRR